MTLKKNVSLAQYTTFNIGGKARYFFVAKTARDVAKAFFEAKEQNLPFFVLGGGSNLLVSDKGFNGLVLKIENRKLFPYGKSPRGGKIYMYAEAGVLFPKLVSETTKKGFSGFEWAGGLPGTVGGAVRGNAGAFGGETKDNILFVECLDSRGEKRKLSKKQCQFSYRNSIFKEKNWIVLGAAFKMGRGNAKKLQAIAEDHIVYRKKRNPLEFPNAGSIFKNCDLKKVPKKWHAFVKNAVKVDPFPVVPTAFLIAEAELKNYTVGRAQVSEKHPNFLINLGGARAKDVEELIARVKKTIKKKFSIRLEEEVQRVG